MNEGCFDLARRRRHAIKRGHEVYDYIIDETRITACVVTTGISA